jgi:hypothetical protein
VTYPITYLNSPHDLPGWFPGALNDQRRGYAYELGEFFVHFYGRDELLWTISPGLTVTQKKTGSLEDWASQIFGAQEIQRVQHALGTVIDGVWRPGLTPPGQIMQALGTNRSEQRSAEQSLYLLVDELNDLFLYVEPRNAGTDAYSAKTRQLLILACTEVEDGWARYLRKAEVQPNGSRGYSTNDYVRLLDSLKLAEYQIGLVPYAGAAKVRPFAGWSATQPTQSLAWYDAYNKAKHDRSTNLPLATVTRCIEAVAAAVVMFSVRFSPFALYNETTPIASLVNHLFSLELVGADPTSFYVPPIDLPSTLSENLVSWDSGRTTPPWARTALTV